MALRRARRRETGRSVPFLTTVSVSNGMEKCLFFIISFNLQAKIMQQWTHSACLHAYDTIVQRMLQSVWSWNPWLPRSISYQSGRRRRREVTLKLEWRPLCDSLTYICRYIQIVIGFIIVAEARPNTSWVKNGRKFMQNGTSKRNLRDWIITSWLSLLSPWQCLALCRYRASDTHRLG